MGETLSPQELQNCLGAVEIVEPPVAKLFWQATEARPGIYIILAGKVRLLDREEYPFYAQHSASDCGSACIVMIGRYWGKGFSLNRLRDLSNTSRSGVSLRSLATAAESIGFATRPVKASLDKFAQQPLPAIALPWAMLSKVDETGSARGRIELLGATQKLLEVLPVCPFSPFPVQT